MPASTKAVSVRGRDAFGKFVVGAGNCVHCKQTGICVKYAPKSFFCGVSDLTYTILKDTKYRIGITCGCYGTFHRQVAHITHNTTRR